jgi:PDZ domain-containing protein/ricin-type beta-trefoil lectin protein
VHFGILTSAISSGLFLVAIGGHALSNTAGRMMIQSHPDLGSRCIDVPYAQFFRGMGLQMWSCNSVLVWGQPNTEVTLGIARKTGRSEIRVRLGETATQGPVAQVFSYDETTQEMRIGNLCMESWGQGDPYDPVVLGACKGAPNQHWRLVASGAYHQIIGIKDLCLEPRNSARENGSPLDIAECGANHPQQLWTLKVPTRGVLGVRWRKPNEQESSSLGLEHGIGIIVEKVLEGGPSEKSGLAAGDAIVTINGQPINGAAIGAPTEKGSSKCSRYVPSVGLTVPVACDEYLGDQPGAKK